MGIVPWLRFAAEILVTKLPLPDRLPAVTVPVAVTLPVAVSPLWKKALLWTLKIPLVKVLAAVQVLVSPSFTGLPLAALALVSTATPRTVGSTPKSLLVLARKRFSSFTVE